MKKQATAAGARAEVLLERGLRFAVTAALVVVGISIGADVRAQPAGGVLNLYSARHYQTDEALYTNFTKQTGIKINRIELGDEPLLERIRNEGANSPADVLLLVDAARLWSRTEHGTVPAGQVEGAGRAHSGAPARERQHLVRLFDARARDRLQQGDTVKREDVHTYEELAEPKNKGKVCTRSGSASVQPVAAWLASSSTAASRRPKAGPRAWSPTWRARPRAATPTRSRRVAAGECGVALTNTYYWVRLLRSTDAERRDIVKNVGFVWPNQATSGTHVNVSGGGRGEKRAEPRQRGGVPRIPVERRKRRTTSPTATTSGPR